MRLKQSISTVGRRKCEQSNPEDGVCSSVSITVQTCKVKSERYVGGIITEDGRSENEIMRSRMSHLMDATWKDKETPITSESHPLIIIEITAPMK